MNPFERIDQLTKENHSMEIAALKLADDYDALKSDLARVKVELEEARAGRMELERFRDRYEPVRQSLIKQEAELAALRARVAELEAALRNIVEWADPFYAHEVRDFESARDILARAESATPAKDEGVSHE